MDEQLKQHSGGIYCKIEEQSQSFAKKFDDNDNKIDKLMNMMQELVSKHTNDE